MDNMSTKVYMVYARVMVKITLHFALVVLEFLILYIASQKYSLTYMTHGNFLYKFLNFVIKQNSFLGRLIIFVLINYWSIAIVIVSPRNIRLVQLNWIWNTWNDNSYFVFTTLLNFTTSLNAFVNFISSFYMYVSFTNLYKLFNS
jgi:hypothetical protein